MTSPLYESPQQLVRELRYIHNTSPSFLSSPSLTHEDLVFIHKILSMSSEEMNKNKQQLQPKTERIFKLLHEYSHAMSNIQRSYFQKDDQELINQIEKALQENPLLKPELVDIIVGMTGRPALFDHLKNRALEEGFERRERDHWLGVAQRIGISIDPSRPPRVQVKEYVTLLVSIPEEILPPEFRQILSSSELDFVEKIVLLKEWHTAFGNAAVLDAIQNQLELEERITYGTLCNYQATLQIQMQLPLIIEKNRDQLAKIKQLILCLKVFIFPEIIGKLTGLESLTLVKSEFYQFPAFISSLANLKELSLRQGNLKYLPDSLHQLSKLETLDISGNQMESLPDVISHLSELKRLNIADMGLHEVPQSLLENLKKLESLDLTNNPLRILPNLSGNLYLQELFAANLGLEEVPAFIENLPLNKLYLSKNPLKVLPEFLGRLPLTELYIEEIGLEEVPDFIENLPLNFLYLSHNPLKVLPDFLGNLPLRFLYIENLGLREFPAFIENLGQLQTLNIRNNQIKRIPDFMVNRPTHIWVSGNSNIQIPPAVNVQQ